MKQVKTLVWMLAEFLVSDELRIWLRLGAKPLAVCVALAGALWLGVWLMPHTAHAETNTLACPVGMEDSGGLCYVPCKDGYIGISSTCWQKCKDGQVDDGAFCRTPGQVFAKASYGRTAGTPLVCAASQQSQGGLCYPRCIPGYYGVGPVCWQYCRAGYADHGASCYRSIFDFYFKASYGRGAGGAVSACPAGTEQSGSLCYPRCVAGYSGAGPVCYQICPAGTKDDGALCRKDAVTVAKDSFGRGVGQVLNSVPEAHDETVRTPKDTPVHLNFPIDDLNDMITAVIYLQNPAHGEIGENIYTPAPGFEGVDSILWKVTDGKNESNVAIATILVGSVGTNSAPVAIDRTVAVVEDTPITITVSCTDAENDLLLYQLLEKPLHGEYRWLPPNQVVYTPSLSFAGTDQFTFRSYDGRDVSNVSVVTLQVAPVNDAPVAFSQTITMTRNSNSGTLLQAIDPEGDEITYTVVTSPTHGELTGAVPNLLYVPAKDFVGTDGLVFRASDGHGAAQEAAITINVIPQNSAPAVQSQVLTTTEETALTIDLQADDADEDDLVFTLVVSPTHGSLAGDGAAWVYTPEAGFLGEDGFTFLTDDGQLTTDGSVTIQVVLGPAEANVMGFVYNDANRNGQPDAGETGAGGLRVKLVPVPSANATAMGSQAGDLEVRTNAAGAWRIERVPLGQYTLEISSASGVTLAEPYTAPLQVDTRGFVAGPIAGVTVTQRSVYLPGLAK
jgi:hypothetical protein